MHGVTKSLKKDRHPRRRRLYKNRKTQIKRKISSTLPCNCDLNIFTWLMIFSSSFIYLFNKQNFANDIIIFRHCVYKRFLYKKISKISQL